METGNIKKRSLEMIFGERFTELCKERGFYGNGTVAQNDLAADLGTSASTINRYASGARIPDPAYLVKLSQFFHVSVDWLLGLVGERYGIVYPKYYAEHEQVNVTPPGLTADQRCLIQLYDKASENDKRIIGILLSKYKDQN